MMYRKLEHATINQILSYNAQAKPNAENYNYLSTDTNIKEKASYLELELRSKAIAAILQQNGIQKGDRILLIYEPGLEFLYAFYGCLYAGAIAIPCYPPVNRSLIDRLTGITTNAEPNLVLSSGMIVQKITQLGVIKFLNQSTLIKSLIKRFNKNIGELTEWDFNKFRWLATDKINVEMAQEFRDVNLIKDDIAFLQYASGSTSFPKGVIVSHQNLIENIRTIQHAVDINADDVTISWLPQNHDMGLIGSILTPLVSQIPVYFFSPIDFIKNPKSWLKTISKYKGTLSAAPNFAYSLCTKKINDDDLHDIDLASWKAALSGAEHINIDVINEFCKLFGKCGFNKKSFFPCYGLAEATLFVSGKYGVNYKKIEDKQHHKVSTEVISCGTINKNVQVVIRDIDTGNVLAEGDIGEVCINGDSVTRGYWNNEDINKEIFTDLLYKNNTKKYLRTGDLGFIMKNELFITGRIKDLIIIRGVNFYPHDIEYTVNKACKPLRHGACVAFSMEEDGEEHLAIVLELESLDQSQALELFKQIKSKIMEEHQLIVHKIVLVKQKSILKTTSGKLKRLANKQALLNNQFTVITAMPVCGEI